MKKLLLVFLLLLANVSIWAQQEYTSDRWKYTLSEEGKATITGIMQTSETDLNIPATIGEANYPVVAIGNRAFFYRSGLTSINIPDGVESIGPSTFADCSSLTSINIPSSVKSIEGLAFKGCSKLTSINIPDSVKSIEYATFKDCSSLTSINIPDSVKSIEASAFAGCSSLTSINIPSSVKSIEGVAFKGCSSLTSINIPDGVKSIEESTFEGCSNLKNLTLDSVGTIGRSAFKHCTSLTDLKLGKVETIGVEAFRSCSNLKNLTLDNVGTIGVMAFSDCTSLTDVTIGKVETIERAFVGCSNLKSLTLDSVGTIKDEAFYGKPNLTDVTIGKVETIGREVFRACSNLKNLTLDSVGTIGGSAFSYCTSLTDLAISKVKTIGGSAFVGCSNLKSLTLDSVGTIGSRAFQLSYSLTDVKLGNVGGIGEYAFLHCPLKSLTLSQTSVGKSAFAGCAYLTDLKIDEVYTIDDLAFAGCMGLKSLTLSENLGWIGRGAFFNCSGLDSVVFKTRGEITIGNSYDDYWDSEEELNLQPDDVFAGCTSLRYIDASEVEFILDGETDNYDLGKPNYTLLYVPENSELSTTTAENVVVGEVCKNFKVYENAGYGADGYGQRGYEYGTAIRKSFTAESASYSGKELTDDGVYSLYLPYATTLPEGVEAYAMSNYRSGERVMVFTKHTGALSAYTPYLLRRVKGSGTKTFNGVAVTNVQVTTAPEALTNPNGGSVQDTDDNTWKFLGTTNPIDNATATANRLYVLEADNTWRPVLESQSGGHVRSLRAFLQAPEGASSAPLVFMLDEGETTTGLEAVETEVEKGRADIYTIEGRFVGRNYESLPSGLYVIGGKKVYKF